MQDNLKALADAGLVELIVVDAPAAPEVPMVEIVTETDGGTGRFAQTGPEPRAFTSRGNVD